MRLRAFQNNDFDEIKTWISDERTHAMWCANLITYPMEEENFKNVMSEEAARFGNRPYAAITDDGRMVGFFVFP